MNNTIYNYSNLNGEFVGASEADISPLEPDVLLIPANATTVKPPSVSKGTAAVFKNGSWVIEDDFRGTSYWMPDYSEHIQEQLGPLPEGATTIAPENHIGTTYWMPDGSKHVMQTLGPLPEGASLIPPPPTKEETLNAISFALQAKLDSGANSWGYANMVTAASYAASTNAQFAADAAALIQWRDNVWAWAIPKFADVTPGETPEEFMVDMPKQPAQPKP